MLTPMAVDSSRPFPLIRNKSLNIGALLAKKAGRSLDGSVGTDQASEKVKGKEKKNKEREQGPELEFATVQVPSGLPRIVRLPDEKDGTQVVILLEEIIERNMGQLFLSYDVVCAHPYRIMRNADLTIEEDEAEDLLKEIQKQLKKRQWGEAIRLEAEEKMDRRLLKLLRRELSIKEDSILDRKSTRLNSSHA